MHIVLVDSSSYLVCIQSLPWLLDEDALVNSAHATQRFWLGGNPHDGLLSWDGRGRRKLQRHLTAEKTQRTIWTLVGEQNLGSFQPDIQ